ncbi:MAG: transcriptional repressor [Bacillota bacterium]
MTSEVKYKKSKQRERMLVLLRNTDIHPTADWLYDQLKREFKDLSMGTVYRNLNILVEQGLVLKLDFGSTFDRFDGNVLPHYHFICEGCGAVLDLPLPVDEALNRKVKEMTNYQVKRHRTEFYGRCDRCVGTESPGSNHGSE